MGKLRVFALCVIAIGVVQDALPSADAAASQCTQRKKRCTCVFPGAAGGQNSSLVVDNQGADSDHRTVGLAAATGALGGLLATGSGLAAYFHFRGNSAAGGGDSGGGFGGGGGGESPGLGGGGKRDGGGGGGHEGAGRGGSNDARPSSTESSDSYGSETPLNKHRDGGGGDQYRPSSVGSTASATTNIYKQSKVWPGRF